MRDLGRYRRQHVGTVLSASDIGVVRSGIAEREIAIGQLLLQHWEYPINSALLAFLSDLELRRISQRLSIFKDLVRSLSKRLSSTLQDEV